MNRTELYSLAISGLSVQKMHPVHKAMLEECCERALENDITSVDTSILITSVQIAFLSCHNTLKSVFKGIAQSTETDEIILNYRGQSFQFYKDSSFLK
jgi:hypothetical protein